MIPWNPIHRYSGMTSQFDSLDGVGQGEAATASPGDWSASPSRSVTERAPLGFVDVRSESSATGDGPVELPVNDPASSEPVSVAPHVELAAVTNEVARAEQTVDEKVPFYKRELSLGRRKPKSVEDEAQLEVVAEVAPELASAEEPQIEELQADEPVPFYKRELSFSRGGGDAVVVESAPEPDAHDVEPEPVLYAVESFEVAEIEDAPAVVDEIAKAPVVEPEPIPAPVAEHEPVAEPVETEHEVVELPVEQSVLPEPVVAVVAEEPAKAKRSSGKTDKPKTQKKKSNNGRRSSRRIVGLKIGASQLAAAVVESNEDGYELVELARTPLEPGIVLDGEVRDAEALANALRSFFAEQKLPTRDVRIGIASNRIGVRTFEIAGLDDESRFDNAVRFKAHEVLPIAVSDSVLDYRVLEERRTESGEQARKILLVVAPRDQVMPYAEVAERAGLKLAGIDLEALGLLRAFVEPDVARTTGGTSTVVVSIGHEASTLLVSGGGACEFTRVFDWGGSTLQEAISQELQVHPVEAATILRHLSLAGNSRRIEGIDDEARNRAVEAVRLRLTPFARELVSSLQFYQTQPDSLGIGEIVITGGTSQLDGLADALHQMIGVAVRVGDPLQRVNVRQGVGSGFEQTLGSLAVPIGLAIDDDTMRTVDLTPRDVTKSAGGRRRALAPALIPVAAAVPLIALGLVFSQAHGKVSKRQSNLTALSAEYAALPEPVGPQIDSGLGIAEAARASAVAQVLGARTSWDGTLRDLSRILPENVWLTSLKASVGSPLSTTLVATAPAAAPAATTPATTPVAPQGLTLSGYTYEPDDVATLLGRLVALSSIQNVQLQSATTATVGAKTVVQFTILADLRGGGA